MIWGKICIFKNLNLTLWIFLLLPPLSASIFISCLLSDYRRLLVLGINGLIRLGFYQNRQPLFQIFFVSITGFNIRGDWVVTVPVAIVRQTRASFRSDLVTCSLPAIIQLKFSVRQYHYSINIFWDLKYILLKIIKY